MRIGPSHPWLGAAGFHLALPLLEFYYRKLAIYRSESRFARDRVRAIKDKIERGETVYLAGVSAAGIHNSGVALVEVTRNGPRLNRRCRVRRCGRSPWTWSPSVAQARQRWPSGTAHHVVQARSSPA